MTSYTAAERLVQITLSNVNITGSLTLTRPEAYAGGVFGVSEHPPQLRSRIFLSLHVCCVCCYFDADYLLCSLCLYYLPTIKQRNSDSDY